MKRVLVVFGILILVAGGLSALDYASFADAFQAFSDETAATLPLLEECLSAQQTLLSVVPLSHPIALAVKQVPREQIPDLPDRIIAATALHQDVPLITRDGRIVLSSVETVW